MKQEDSAREVVPLFDKHWQKTVKKYEGYDFDFVVGIFERNFNVLARLPREGTRPFFNQTRAV